MIFKKMLKNLRCVYITILLLFINSNLSAADKEFNETELNELDKFLDFQDDVIWNYYHHGIIEQNIDKNKISKIFKDHSF